MSRYANMDHGRWLEANLKRKLTPYQHRVANVIGIVAGGIYNAPINWKSADFDLAGRRGVAVNWMMGEFATTDFNALTMLVFLAHEERIRIAVKPITTRYMKILFFERKADGNNSQRHPSLDEAIADFRAWYRPLGRFVAAAGEVQAPEEVAP